MSTSKLPCIPSLRRQQLHLEFASLKHAPPPGVYVTLAIGDPTLWNGVIFVRSGPYASAILRFQIRFPDTYPDLPPLVTFATDVFHPLIVPLTTYTFSTNSTSDNPVSATDEERLPPGGFSLRHGFPHWFGRARRSGFTSQASSRNVSGNDAGDPTSATKDSNPEEEKEDKNQQRVAAVPSIDQFAQPKKIVPVSEILEYMRSSFDDEDVLDSLPADAAGNPGAWHAWKAHRGGGSGSEDLKRGNPQARQPGDWHWDGIWARRVQREIETSYSDPMLFGNAGRGSEEAIRFSRLDQETLESVKEEVAVMVEGSA